MSWSCEWSVREFDPSTPFPSSIRVANQPSITSSLPFPPILTEHPRSIASRVNHARRELIAIPENRTFLSLTPLPEGCTLLPSGILSCETDQQMSGVAFTIVGVWNREMSSLHRHTTSLPPIATTQQTRSLDDCQRLHLLSEAAPDGYLNSMDCHVVTPSTLTSTPPPIYIPLHLSIARTLSLVSSSIARIQPPSSLRLFSDEHEIEDSITLPYACTHGTHPSL